MVTVRLKKEKFTPFVFVGNMVKIYINNATDGDYYICDELSIMFINKDYIINSIVRANYPSDKMDAIRNNYDLVRDGTAGDKTQEYTQEYNKMQDWRRYCKELAAEIMTNKSNKV